MKSVWIVACALLLVSVAAFAAPAPSPAPLSDAALAAILGAPLNGGACAKAQPAAHRSGTGGTAGLALKSVTCTANCQGGGTVSCTANNNCNAVNGDCTNGLEAGHVTCDGVTTTCTPACCSTGTIHDKLCCQCDGTGDCFACCRCGGGGAGHCAIECG